MLFYTVNKYNFAQLLLSFCVIDNNITEFYFLHIPILYASDRNVTSKEGKGK